MNKYFSLMQSNPELFNNDKALLKINLDQGIISKWEAKKKIELRSQNLPIDWAKIGVILNDPYNIIVRDLVEFPNGELRGYSRSIATASLKGGRATVVFPEHEGKILLIHLFRHVTRKWHYEVPRGYGEPNVSPEENAYKEIKEETGGEVSELVNLGETYNNNGYEAVPVSLFFAKLKSVGEANINEGIESFVWLTAEELEEWIESGKINDGFTIAAYARAKLKGLI